MIEVLDALNRVAGEPVPRVIGPRRAGDPPLLVASNRALVDTLGWSPRFAEIDAIITHALAWERILQARAGS